MVRVRHLLLSLASGSALYSGMLPALGLGEITLHSALNQPLDAEIELLEVGDLTDADLLVRLASVEAFRRAEVERLFFLSDLRFTPRLRGAGSRIRVQSSKPVREPYLNFLVELVRPNGSLLREYTLLIDPPGSSAYRALAAAPLGERAVKPRPSLGVAPAPPPALQGKRYRVVRGDSLWAIAKRLRAAGSQASVAELMAGIQALNPQAFVGGDSDRLKAGASLLLPDLAAPRAAAAPPATAEPAEPVAAPAEAPSESSLQQIAEAQRRVDSELAASAAQNQQLQQQMAELQHQLLLLERQLSSKDRQVAALQADLARLKATTAPGPAVVGGAPAAAAPRQKPAASPAWVTGLASGALLLILLFAGLLLVLRRRTQKPGAPALQPLDSALAPPVQGTAQAAAAAVESIPAAQTAMSVSSAPTDALEGAKIYIAYGRFSEALGVLRMAVDQAPQRLDLRLRLLEVLGELGDGVAFAREEALLRELGVGAEQLAQIKARYPALATAADRGTAPDPLEHAVPMLDQPGSTEVGHAAAEDAQLNLDDLSLDADWDSLNPFDTAAPAHSKAAAAQPTTPEPGFNSNLEELPEVFELTVSQDFLSPIDEPSAVAGPEEEVLEEEFLDVFRSEPQRPIDKPLEADLDQLASSHEHLTKLNLALAYIEQGDMQSACSILNQVISEGDDEEKREARALLAMIA